MSVNLKNNLFVLLYVITNLLGTCNNIKYFQHRFLIIGKHNFVLQKCPYSIA